MGSGRHSSSGLGGHRIRNDRGGYQGAAIHGPARAVLIAVLLFATPLWAQSDATSDVTINYDVLNNLVLPARGGALQEAAKLRPPPSQPPQSRLLVRPVREVARAPATEAPPKVSESPEQPPAASPPTPADKIDSTPVVSEPAPVRGAATAPLVSVPAVPPPPEPADSPTSDTVAIVPPPPPPPPLEPSAGSEVPPPPEPAAIAAAPLPSDRRKPATGQAAGKQLAARPATVPGPAPLRLRFAEGSAELSDQARGQLATLKDLLLADQAQRIQLLAYAKGGEQQANAARRLSLSRARAIRAFLAERGVATSRVDVRALGVNFEDGPPDRVDIVYAKR